MTTSSGGRGGRRQRMQTLAGASLAGALVIIVGGCGDIDRLAYLFGQAPPCVADENCPNAGACVEGQCTSTPPVEVREPAPAPEEPEPVPEVFEPDPISPEPAPAPSPEGGLTCGDDVIDSDVGEVCDDGNTDDQDGCSSTCQRWFDAAWPMRWEVVENEDAPFEIGVPTLLHLGADVVTGRASSNFCVVADDLRALPTDLDTLNADEGLLWTLIDSAFDTLWVYESDGPCPTDVGVFDASYDAVWHLGATGLQSAVGPTNNLVEVGATESVVGPVGQATALDQFTNPLSRLTSGTQSVALHGALTIEAWVRVDFFGESNEWPNTVIECAGEGFFDIPCFMHIEETGHLRVSWFSASNPPLLENIESTVPIPGFALGQWHHVVQVRDESTGFMTFYADGLPLGDVVPIDRLSRPANAVRVQLGGSRDFETRSLHGALDEIRISQALHSAEWIAMQYRNMTAPLLVNSAGESVPTLTRP